MRGGGRLALAGETRGVERLPPAAQTGIRDMETQGAESVAEAAIVTEMRLICQTQEPI